MHILSPFRHRDGTRVHAAKIVEPRQGGCLVKTLLNEIVFMAYNLTVVPYTTAVGDYFVDFGGGATAVAPKASFEADHTPLTIVEGAPAGSSMTGSMGGR